MSRTIDVTVPDIGDFKDVPVIEVLVKPGDRVNQNDALATLESDKASMEIPSSASGVVSDVRVKVGDKVSQGSTIVTLATEDSAAPVSEVSGSEAPVSDAPVSGAPIARTPNASASSGRLVELTVPDIGDFRDIPVIDVLVRAGDTVAVEAPLVTLESDKASMDVPAAEAGVIDDVRVVTGDRVSAGSIIATLRVAGDAPPAIASPASAAAQRPGTTAHPLAGEHPPKTGPAGNFVSAPASSNGAVVHASPAVRKLARELGVELRTVKGTGPHERITRSDVQEWVKSALSTAAPSARGDRFAGLPAWPAVDFAQFGDVERRELPRIKRISGPNLHRNWLQIPHITNYDEADVTELEAFRQRTNAEHIKGGAKLTMLAFLVRACVSALMRFPEFNASLDGDALIYKKYYNIGFAADTPGGLVVPVLKSADSKGLLQLADEAAELAAKAREGKLGMGDMGGGTFTISSIGGIGGTQFTQIVNAPEVAILGATRSTTRPVWNGASFEPRLMLPISVSYDHRVIDGALAARFLNYVGALLADFRRVLL